MISHKPLEINSRYILIIAMLYMTVSLAAVAVAYKFVTIGPLIESGATVTFPLTFLLGDIVTEVYGYKVARKLIWFGLACEIVFAFLVTIVVNMHYPKFFHHESDYIYVLGSSIRFVFSGIIADVASSFLNVYIISKWKIFVKGKYFWLRSIAATTLSEFVMVILIILLGFLGTASIGNIMKIMVSAYILHVLYSCIFVWPAWALIIILKKTERIDAYDYTTNYNPFVFD